MNNIKKIFKGCHYGFPFPFPKCLNRFVQEIQTSENPKQIYFDEHIVEFDDSIIYELPGDDQMDVNKLFGFSYGWHHTNSDRIGFRYIPDKGVEIVLYSYCNGKRESTKHIAYIKTGEKYSISLSVDLEDNVRRVIPIVHNRGSNDEFEFNTFYINDGGKSLKTKIRYTLGIYFGGNRRAPHTITIYDEQIKNKKLK